jgi:hypothetical protein
MKNKVILFLLITIIGQIFTSCECQKIDCEPDDYFSIVMYDKSDSSNLYESKVVDLDSIQVSRLLINNKSENWDFKFFDTINNQKPIFAVVNPGIKGYVFKYNEMESDTLLLFSHVAPVGKCCGGNAVLDFGIFRGDTIRDFQSYQEMKIYR